MGSEILSDRVPDFCLLLPRRRRHSHTATVTSAATPAAAPTPIPALAATVKVCFESGAAAATSEVTAVGWAEVWAGFGEAEFVMTAPAAFDEA